MALSRVLNEWVADSRSDVHPFLIFRERDINEARKIARYYE